MPDLDSYDDTPSSIPEGYSRDDLFHCESPRCNWSGNGWGLELDGTCPICRAKRIAVGIEKTGTIISPVKSNVVLYFGDDLKKLSPNQLRVYIEKIKSSGALKDHPEIKEHSEETDDIYRSYSEACGILAR